jgi:glycine C-acetyltransferase
MSVYNQSIRGLQLLDRNQNLAGRINMFDAYMAARKLTYLRSIESPAGRSVLVKDPFTGEHRNMLMFASNNYLGLANHPHVLARIKRAMSEYGCGIGGPPLLNGYLKLTAEAEERLAALKSQETAMLFSSGFLANAAVVSTLAQACDIILYDDNSHASFYDALKLTRAKAISFSNNNMAELELLLIQHGVAADATVFVCVEGVYSMDGHLAPLDRISVLCRQYGAMLVVDDAHGTGVIGANGGGTAAYFNCSKEVDVMMGTFSKVFASCGGFLAGSKPMINYLRFHARPYIFSAAIPPTVIAAVLGGLEVMEQEPWLQQQLLENTRYAVEKLAAYEFCATPQAAIICLKVPPKMEIRKAALLFHERDIFINAIEYPAVAANRQRFRISIMTTHTKEDIDCLAEAVEAIWSEASIYND